MSAFHFPKQLSRDHCELGLGAIWLTVLYASLFYLTKPLNWGDTVVYAPQIVNVSRGIADPTQLWEFGHLLWRPLGELVWRAGRPFWSQQGRSSVLEVYAALRFVNLVLGLVAIFAAYAIIRRIALSTGVAVLLCSAFMGWNAFMNYFQTGTAYEPGLAMQLAGLYFLLGDANGRRSILRGCAGGAALALSVCLWFPFVLGVPAILLFVFCWNWGKWGVNRDRDHFRLRWICCALGVCFLLGASSFAVGARLGGVRSGDDLKRWVIDSRHGWHPTKTYLRVATGLPRSLVDLGQDGLMVKRFVLHDPYAAIRAKDLVQVVEKLAVFYFIIGILIWRIYRDQEAKLIAIALAVNWTMLLYFAIFLFEPSTAERYMPGFTTLLVGFAFVSRRDSRSRVASISLCALFMVVWVLNFRAYASPSEPNGKDPAVARLEALKPVLSSRNLITLLSFQDDISVFFSRFPFNRIRPEDASYYYIADQSTGDPRDWRNRFADRVFLIWSRQGDVWVSKRLIAERPASEWGWAEGDDPNLRWREIPAFFRQFVFDRDIGGHDGFSRLARTPSNEKSLKAGPG